MIFSSLHYFLKYNKIKIVNKIRSWSSVALLYKTIMNKEEWSNKIILKSKDGGNECDTILKV